MKATVALLMLLLAGAVPGRAGNVDGYTILLGNNTDKPCTVLLHFKSGEKWETKGWWTIEPRKIGTLVQSTDDELYLFIQTPGGYFGSGDKRILVPNLRVIEHVTYDAELPFTRITAQVRQDEQGNRYFYAELLPQTTLSRETAYRDVYFLNNHDYGKTVTLAVHYQDLEGIWRTTDWIKIEAGHRQKVCRTRESKIYTALRGRSEPPQGAEVKEIQTGAFKTRFYAHSLPVGAPYPPVYIDVLPLWNPETEAR